MWKLYSCGFFFLANPFIFMTLQLSGPRGILSVRQSEGFVDLLSAELWHDHWKLRVYMLRNKYEIIIIISLFNEIPA